MIVRNSHRYDDLIDLEYPRPDRDLKKHPPMPVADRAKIFAPFAAFSGYGQKIIKTGQNQQREVEEEIHKEIFYEDLPEEFFLPAEENNLNEDW